jgi:hypothetical protein
MGYNNMPIVSHNIKFEENYQKYIKNLHLINESERISRIDAAYQKFLLRKNKQK